MRNKVTEIPIGVIFSTSGAYGAVGGEMLNGTLLAIEEINLTDAFDFSLVAHICDPGGENVVTQKWGATS